jgi:hypothetical protein
MGRDTISITLHREVNEQYIDFNQLNKYIYFNISRLY